MRTHEEHRQAIEHRWLAANDQLDLQASQLAEGYEQEIATHELIRRSLYPAFRLQCRLPLEESVDLLAQDVSIWVGQVRRVITEIEHDLGACGVIILHATDPGLVEKAKRYRKTRILTQSEIADAAVKGWYSNTSEDHEAALRDAISFIVRKLKAEILSETLYDFSSVESGDDDLSRKIRNSIVMRDDTSDVDGYGNIGGLLRRALQRVTGKERAALKSAVGTEFGQLLKDGYDIDAIARSVGISPEMISLDTARDKRERRAQAQALRAAQQKIADIAVPHE